jgi:hypothetical protein
MSYKYRPGIPFDSVRGCEYPGCDQLSVGYCDLDDNYFCSDHGTVGGDRQVQDVGAVAYPSQCWNCGGFNADEGLDNRDGDCKFTLEDLKAIKDLAK